MTDSLGTGRDIRIFVEVLYPDLSVFLKDAARYFANECVFSRGTPALEAGTRARLWLVLPVMEERLECTARAQKSTDGGVLFEVLEWRSGDSQRLWRFVALGWAMLRGAAHPRFQEPPPELAGQIDVRTVVRLEGSPSGADVSGVGARPFRSGEAPAGSIGGGSGSSGPGASGVTGASGGPGASGGTGASFGTGASASGGDSWHSPAPDRQLAELWRAPGLKAEVVEPWKTPVPVTEVAALRRASVAEEGAGAQKTPSSPGLEHVDAPRVDRGNVEPRRAGPPPDEKRTAPAPLEKGITPSAGERRTAPPTLEKGITPPAGEKRTAPPLLEKGITPPADEKRGAPKRIDRKGEPPAFSGHQAAAPQRAATAVTGGQATARPGPPGHPERESIRPPTLRPTRRPAFEPASNVARKASSTSSFECRSLASRLASLLVEARTGCLEMFSAGISRQLHLEYGAIIQIEQRPRADLRLLATAMNGVGLDWESVRDVQDRLLHEDMPEQRLIELERLTPEDAEMVMSRRLSLQLQRAIESGWEGEASFDEAQPEISSRDERSSLTPWPPVPLARLIWDGLRTRAFDHPERMLEFGETMARRTLAWSVDAQFPLHDAFLRPEEQSVLQRLRTDLPALHHHLKEEGPSDRVALAVVWSLIQIEQLESTLQAELPPDNSQATLIADLHRQERAMQSWDHFKTLELAWSVHPSEIQPAFDRLLVRYRPYTRSREPELSQVGQAILRRLFAALEVLGQARSRQEYRRRTMGKELAEIVDQVMQEGESHDLKGELKEALRCFERAVDMSPHRADCRDRLVRQRKVVERQQKG